MLTLNEVQGTFYSGKLTGSAGFDFTRYVGTDFHFDAILTGAKPDRHNWLTPVSAPVGAGSLVR